MKKIRGRLTKVPVKSKVSCGGVLKRQCGETDKLFTESVERSQVDLPIGRSRVGKKTGCILE